MVGLKIFIFSLSINKSFKTFFLESDDINFHSACKQGNISLVKQLLDEKIDLIYEKYEYGKFVNYIHK